MGDVRFVQVNHLHPDNSLHTAGFPVVRGDDVPAGARDAGEAEYRAAMAQTLGYAAAEEVPAAMRQAFFWVHNSMIHDIGNLHGLFGPPAAVLSTEIWADGGGITTTLAYADGKRAVCTWVDLPELWAFEETVEVYGSRERVIVSFPTGFSKGLPTTVTLHGTDADRLAWRKELSWHDNPFALELDHLYACAREGERPLTPGREAMHDIALVRDIITKYAGLRTED
jgi:hypothetical protein